MPSVPRKRRSRLAAGGVAVAVASAWTAAFALPAHAQTPTFTVDCTTSEGSILLAGRVEDFPPSESFALFAFLQFSDDGSTTLQGGGAVTTDETGAATTIRFPFGHPLPIDVSVAVFRDLNGNVRWDDGDDTLYRGSTTVTSCPSSTVVSPK